MQLAIWQAVAAKSGELEHEFAKMLARAIRSEIGEMFS